MEYGPTKTCSDCKRTLDVSLFSRSGVKSNLRPQCKACTRARETAQIAERRAREGPPPATRTCSKCCQEKPLVREHFKRCSAKPFGFANECRVCQNARNVEWVKTEKGRAMTKRYRLANAQVVKERNRRWMVANRDKYNAYLKVWRQRTIERRREVNRLSARRNSLRKSAYRQIRRAAGSVTKADISTLLERQRMRCAICREKLLKAWEVDHVLPVRKGGRSDIDNLQILCRPCNRSKGARDPIEHMQRLGFLL